MSVGLPSDEVAEDYKNSLEDLTLNSRYEISNLTVIAKENTEHALAISRVLENHIRNTPPDRKLPALYVLDSIAKNVGTPYTLFLGRNLYSIFMDAYSLVNQNVRKKLDEMLATWGQPVPGSNDSRPVFSHNITRPISTALLKARTAAVQEQHQQQVRTQREMMTRQRLNTVPDAQWRSTPTPPQANGRYYPPPQQGFLPNLSNGHHPASKIPRCFLEGFTNIKLQQRPSQAPSFQYTASQQAPQQIQPAYAQTYQQPTSYPTHSPVPQLLATLDRDIAELIRSTKEQLATNVYDKAIQSRLQALLALQSLMSQQQLPVDQLNAVRNQINALSITIQPSGTAPFVPIAQATPPQYSMPSHQRLPQTAPPQTPDLQASLNSKNLADIISRAQRAPATPGPPQASLPQPQPTPISNSVNQSAPADLLATLRAKGLLAADSSTPVNGLVGYPPPPSVTGTPPTVPANVGSTGLTDEVELTSASLKRYVFLFELPSHLLMISRPRPHLISALYGARPNHCSTCGRRFLATGEDREKKARHLDWHFKTNQRLVDSAKRGQSRSWYVDELVRLLPQIGIQVRGLQQARNG